MKTTWIGIALIAATFGVAGAADAGSISIQIGTPFVPVTYCAPVRPVVQTYYYPAGYYRPPATRISTRCYRPPVRPAYGYGYGPHRAPIRTPYHRGYRYQR